MGIRNRDEQRRQAGCIAARNAAGTVRQNEFHAIETELAGHAAFGDARRILDRRRAFALLSLKKAASRASPSVQAFCKELCDERHRPAADAILADPVMLADIDALPSAIRRGDESRVAETEELCATMLRRMRTGTSDFPTAAGCPLRIHPPGASFAIALWDPDVPASIFKRRVEAAFHASCPKASLRRPEPAFVDAIERGCALLALVLPELCASVLAHVCLIGVVDSGRWSSSTAFCIVSTFFIRLEHSRPPWKIAETLLHEALHCKLGDIVRTRSIFSREYAGFPKIRAVWRENQTWHPSRAFSAFHVYVHLALFFARVEHMETAVAGAFGAMPASFRRGFQTALERAEYLRRAINDIGLLLTRDGRLMFAWLSQMLQRLSAAA